MKTVKILGVNIFCGFISDALEEVEKWLENGGKKHYIVTPNPEILILAQKEKGFAEILNQADLALPDGVGLLWAAKILGKSLKERIAGVDFMEKLCEMVAKKGFTVGLIGGKNQVAVKAAERLEKRYPGLKVVLATEEWPKTSKKDDRRLKIEDRSRKWKVENGNNLSSIFDSPNLPSTLDLLPSSIDLLFVAFGAPKQEIWISRNLESLPVKVAMGVGGAFDYLAGVVPRAPQWVQNLGLEWLFRLVRQPWRVKRQIAILKFVLLTLKEKIVQFSITLGGHQRRV